MILFFCWLIKITHCYSSQGQDCKVYLLYHTCTILYIDSNFSPQISCSIGYNIYSQIIDVFHLIVYSKSAMHADELSLLCLCFTIQHIFVKKTFVVILGKSHYMIYSLVTAMKPRMLVTFDKDFNPLPVSVRVGQVSVASHYNSHLGITQLRLGKPTPSIIFTPGGFGVGSYIPGDPPGTNNRQPTLF